jgi:NAD(P)H-dependent flavin oxidoreductase YrpB (nitropropane dioxygenase family)
VLDALRIPVLAAGGIATARDLAAVLACGAAGARIGTRFVACAESGAHPDYVKALLARARPTPVSPRRSRRSGRMRRTACCARRSSGGAADRRGRRRDRDRGDADRDPALLADRAECTTGQHRGDGALRGRVGDARAHVQPAAAIVAELVAGASELHRR